MVERLNCSNDDFIRTTEERHHRSSEAIWERMEKTGDIYLDKYSGWYSVRDEAYYDERRDAAQRAQGQRIGPQTARRSNGSRRRAISSSSPPTRTSCSISTQRVPDFVLPKERLNEVASFVRGGLQDLSISRTTFDWGVPVPGNAKHIMYVWVDALTNYITGGRLSRHRQREVPAATGRPTCT